MTFLRDERLIEPIQSSERDTRRGRQDSYWAVEFDLVLTAEGRSLKYAAEWRGHDVESHVVSIAAAFKPGTA